MKRVLIAAALVLGGCGAEAPPAKEATAATCVKAHDVIIVRHGEKAAEGGADPELSDAGKRRAAWLGGLLAKAHVTRLVASDTQRTQATLRPVADALRVPIETRPAKSTKDLIAELARTPDGAIVVVAWHSNTIPEIVRELGAGTLAGLAESDTSLAEDDYDRVIVMSFGCGAGKPIVLELTGPK